MRWLKIQLIFYNNFNKLTLSITLISCFYLLQATNSHFIFAVFWLKATTWLLAIVYYFLFTKGQLDFYRNLGVRPIHLFGFSIGFDFLTWALLSSLTLYFA
jgi:hypothetical protein